MEHIAKNRLMVVISIFMFLVLVSTFFFTIEFLFNKILIGFMGLTILCIIIYIFLAVRNSKINGLIIFAALIHLIAIIGLFVSFFSSLIGFTEYKQLFFSGVIGIGVAIFLIPIGFIILFLGLILRMFDKE